LITGRNWVTLSLGWTPGKPGRNGWSIDREDDMAKYGEKAQSKVEKAMHERKAGSLRSGRSGKKVKSRKQAIAIGLSEARREGGKVPAKKSAGKTTKRAAKKTTKRAAKKTTKRAAKKTTKRATKKTTKRAAKKSTKRAAKKSTKRSAKKTS
jgi:hypothetical protein